LNFSSPDPILFTSHLGEYFLVLILRTGGKSAGVSLEPASGTDNKKVSFGRLFRVPLRN
jgi:hypothetical protein